MTAPAAGFGAERGAGRGAGRGAATDWTLHRIEVSRGVYRGLLVGPEGASPPALTLAVAAAETGAAAEIVPREPGRWEVRAAFGPEILSDGTRTVVLRAGDDVMDSLTVIVGLEAPDDLRAELDVLRAELAILKRAFRRHAAAADAGGDGSD